MAKKSSTQPESEPLTTAAKKPAKPKASASKAAKSSSPAKAKAAAVAKPLAAVPAVKKTRKKQIAAEEIQLRAYFISESRQQQGLPGDSESDWIEAERQLLAEISVKPIL